MLVNFVKYIFEAKYNIRVNRGWGIYQSDNSINIEILRKIGTKRIREEFICQREIDSPPLAYGDRIFDKELNTNFYVKDFIRNTDNTYTCVIDYIAEDTEESLSRKYELEKSMLESNIILDRLKNEIENHKQEIENLNKIIKSYKYKSTWQLIKERFV